MKRFALMLVVVGMVMLFASYAVGFMLGPRSPHGADMGTQAAHPAADTIQRVPQAVVIGAATVVAMVTAGVVAQLGLGWGGGYGGWGASSSSSGYNYNASSSSSGYNYWPASSSSSGYYPASSSSSGWY